jgi:bacterioferritin
MQKSDGKAIQNASAQLKWGRLYGIVLLSQALPSSIKEAIMVQKASPKLTEMMNQAIAGELQAIVQYMWHHVMIKGINSQSLSGVFEEISVDEMKHAEKIAERLFYFDVAPTTKPTPIAIGGTEEQMLKADVKAEEEAITLYKIIVKQAAEEGDTTTKRLFEEILADEERHHDTFTTLLGQ